MFSLSSKTVLNIFNNAHPSSFLEKNRDNSEPNKSFNSFPNNRNFNLSDAFKHSGNKNFSLNEWENSRKFIVGAISKPGSILDVGCGNGMLLRSLMEWSDYPLVPYGVDVNTSFLSHVKDIFPDNYQNHFAKSSFQELVTKGIPEGLPRRFDYIYCSVNHSPQTIKGLLKHVKPGGRLVLAFYGNYNKNNIVEFEKRIQTAKENGITFSKIQYNQGGQYNIMAYIDKVD